MVFDCTAIILKHMCCFKQSAGELDCCHERIFKWYFTAPISLVYRKFQIFFHPFNIIEAPSVEVK